MVYNYWERHWKLYLHIRFSHGVRRDRILSAIQCKFAKVSERESLKSPSNSLKYLHFPRVKNVSAQNVTHKFSQCAENVYVDWVKAFNKKEKYVACKSLFLSTPIQPNMYLPKERIKCFRLCYFHTSQSILCLSLVEHNFWNSFICTEFLAKEQLKFFYGPL